MAKTLQLDFSTTSGKRMLLPVDEPRVNLTKQEVEAAMQEFINSAAFEVNGSPLEIAQNARIIERNVTELMNG